MPKLTKGDKAPDFELIDQDIKKISLEGFKGRRVLIYFYPKADTPGCTKQSCNVRDSIKKLQTSGIIAIGISPDSPEKQKKFNDKFGLKFPLLSDTDHKVAEAYGVWGEKNTYGKKVTGIIRSSFLLDEEGTIIEAWYNVKPDDTVSNAMDALSLI
jgi:thioredoxin-dependent peroxiredoxin